MTSDAIWKLQKAVYDKLTGDSGLMGLVGNRVYEFVPQETQFPFISIEDFSSSDWSTKTSKGTEIMFNVDAISRDREVKMLMR